MSKKMLTLTPSVNRALALLSSEKRIKWVPDKSSFFTAQKRLVWTWAKRETAEKEGEKKTKRLWEKRQTERKDGSRKDKSQRLWTLLDRRRETGALAEGNKNGRQESREGRERKEEEEKRKGEKEKEKNKK